MKLYDDGMMNTTMMSMGEVMNVDSMKMMNSMGAEVRTDDRMMTKCVHKRGTCITHNIKGKKSIVKHKRWGKVKTGYGWIHSQTVKYTCPMDSCPTGHKIS